VAGLQFDLNVERDDGGVVRVVVRGELDLATAGRLEAALAEPPGSTVLVDLRGLTFMDSTGVRTLLQATEDCRRDGRALSFLVPASGDARLTMAETGIEALLPVVHEPAEDGR
jgi:anti-sigma B factor antagonist/stage II sporulation protein AA (anti-sigma F factor antagonist)